MKQPTILQLISTSMGKLWTIHEHTCTDVQEMHEYVDALNIGKYEIEYKVIDLEPNPFNEIFGTNTPVDIAKMETGLVDKEQRLASIDAVNIFKQVLKHDEDVEQDDNYYCLPVGLKTLINNYIKEYSQ